MQSIFRIVFITLAILLLPLIAMQFTDEVVWTLSDFVVAGALLLGTGTAYELLARRIKTPTRKIAVGVVLLLLLVLIWADLAVGIFNIPGISGS